MTPDELRALADAKPVAAMPPLPANWTERHTSVQAWVESDGVQLNVHGNFDSNDQRIAYAQEIARRLNAAPTSPAGWRLVPVEPTPEMLSAVGMMDGYDWHAPGCSPDADHVNWYSAMIAAAPAAPQAAPMADSDADYWLRNRQSILDGIERAGFMLMSNASGFWLHPRGKTDAQAGPIDPHMIAAEDRFPDAPQAEPCIGNDSACPCQDGDACHYKDAADGTKAWPVPQAEPKRDQSMLDLLAVIHCDGGHHTEAVGIEQSIKDALSAVCVLKGKLAQAEPQREPLSDERIDAALQSDPAMVLALMSGEMTVGEFKAALRRLARTVERAHGIGGSDAE